MEGKRGGGRGRTWSKEQKFSLGLTSENEEKRCSCLYNYESIDIKFLFGS